MNAYKFCMTDDIKEDLKTFREPLTELKGFASDAEAIARAKSEGESWHLEWCVFETFLDFSKDKLIFWDEESRLALFACPTTWREEVIKIIGHWFEHDPEAFECAGFWLEQTEQDVDLGEVVDINDIIDESKVKVMYRDPKTDDEKYLGLLCDLEEILEGFSDKELQEIIYEKCRNYIE